MGIFKSAAKVFSPAYLAHSIMGKNKGQNPADVAMPYLNQIPGIAQQNLGPWQEQGQQAQQTNQPIYNKMANDPADFLNQLQASYSPSKGYQFKQSQLQKAYEGQAAAGGYANTPQAHAAQQQLMNDLLSGDMGEYLNRALSVQQTGLQGNENVATRGFGAATDATNILGTNLGNQAQLAYRGQENKNAERQNILKILGQLAGAGIGGAVGGPAGASVGAGIGGALGGQGGSTSGPSNYQQFGGQLYGGR